MNLTRTFEEIRMHEPDNMLWNLAVIRQAFLVTAFMVCALGVYFQMGY